MKTLVETVAVCIVTLGACLFATPLAAQQSDRFFTFASGGVKGIYFPVAARICQEINTLALAHGERCGVMATSGTNDNLKGIAMQEFDFAIVQSNALIKTLKSEGKGQLVTVASLHPEPVHIAVRSATEIKHLADLEGLILNAGDAGSGSREIAVALLQKAGISPEYEDLRSHGPSTQARRLCDGHVDALIWVSGIGNASIVEAQRRCGVRLLNIPDKVRLGMLDELPGLVEILIPANTYEGQSEPVKSFGPIARIVAGQNVDFQRAELVATAVLGSDSSVRRVHPALSDLSEEDLQSFFPQEVGVAELQTDHD